MSELYVRNVVEAALLAAGRPLQLADLAPLFGEPRPDNTALRAALTALTVEYETRGIEIKETASGFRIQVRACLAAEISRLWPERPVRYSRALLETLALIAYRQPITRAEIEAVRGVAVNPNILKTVIERNWVRVVGHREVPGRPELLGTTAEFLDYFGLKRLEDLPALADIRTLGEVPVQLELPAQQLSDTPRPPQADGLDAGGADPGQPAPDGSALAGPADGAGAEAPETAASPKADDPDPSADPPSPFVEAVIAPPEAPRRRRRRKQDTKSRERAAGPPDSDPAPDEEDAPEPSTEGKRGMAAAPQGNDE